MGKTRRRKPTSKTQQARRMHREFNKRYEPPDDLEEDFNVADFPELASSLVGTQDITNPEIEQIKAEAEAIINSGKAQPSSGSRPTFSVDAPRTDDPDAHNLVWWIPAADKYIPLADHGLRQRGLDLRAFALVAPMAMNAMAVLVKKTQSLQWFIEAGRNLAIKWQSFFNNVEIGRGWDYFVARLVRAYSESDRGAYVEIIRYAPPWAVDENHQLTDRGKAAIKRGDDKYWEIADLHVLDPVQCSPTTSQEFPLIYDNPRSGTRHQLRQYNFMHVIDMPGVDSSKPGLGYCAISRSAWAAKEDTMISRYAMEKMSDNPGAGLVAANVAANVLKSALKKANAQREARGIVYYKGLIFVPLLDPSGRFSLEFLNFSELIDNFNRMENYNILKETVAAAFGIDPLELGSLPGHQLGSGKQAGVLSEKARGKGMGAIIIGITRELRHKVLPSHVRFRFQPQDITEEAAKAEVHQTYFRNAFVMAKAGWDTDMINQYLIFKEAIPRSLVEKQAPNIELSDTEAAKAARYGDLIRIDNFGTIKMLTAAPRRAIQVPSDDDYSALKDDIQRVSDDLSKTKKQLVSLESSNREPVIVSAPHADNQAFEAACAAIQLAAQALVQEPQEKALEPIVVQAESAPQTFHIHMPPQEFGDTTINVPPTELPAMGDIIVNVPEQKAAPITVESPIINVEVPEQKAAQVDVVVNVPEQQAPEVNVTVEAPEIPINIEAELKPADEVIETETVVERDPINSLIKKVKKTSRSASD